MKRILLAMISVIMMLAIAGCSTEAKNECFRGVVLESHDDYLIVQPNQDESIYESYESIKVSKEVISTHGVPTLEEGDKVRIVYADINEKSEEPAIDNVFAIYFEY